MTGDAETGLGYMNDKDTEPESGCDGKGIEIGGPEEMIGIRIRVGCARNGWVGSRFEAAGECGVKVASV